MQEHKEGYIWVEGHYRKAPAKESYPRSVYPLVLTGPEGKDVKHKIRNLKKQIKDLEELLED